MKQEVLDTVQAALTGEVEAARRLAELWRALPPDDFFHRCVLAHYVADLQTEPNAELHWDELALEAALAAAPESFEQQMPGLTWESFLPSLHLNLASSYERTSSPLLAQEHARLALRSSATLPATPLAETTRGAILRICERLGVSRDG